MTAWTAGRSVVRDTTGAMELRTLQRIGGVALGAGAVLLAAYSICFSVVFPSDALVRDLRPFVVQPAWMALSAVAQAGVLLMMLGFGAVYTRMAAQAGVVGFLGIVTIEIAYLVQAAKITWELCWYPLLARHPGSADLLVGRAFVKDPGIAAFRLVAMGTILVGIVLFSLALIRSRDLPRGAGALVFAGAVAYGAGPMLSVQVAHAGIVVFAAGCLWLAGSLLRRTGTAVESRSVPQVDAA